MNEKQPSVEMKPDESTRMLHYPAQADHILLKELPENRS